MNRSPLYCRPHRAGDADAGGAADLQTDVMRFMAILALCLVAIFALVQSIPLTPVTSAQPEAVAEPEPIAPLPNGSPPAVAEAPESPTQTRAGPPATRATPPEPTTPEPAAADEGFTLRFESDRALTRLVARNEIGVYAIVGNRALRMAARQGRLSFWPASIPNRMHEMDAATVPADVVRSLRRSGSVATGDEIGWGVTLPAGMRQQLDRYLAEHDGGALVIAADGNLRLDR